MTEMNPFNKTAPLWSRTTKGPQETWELAADILADLSLNSVLALHGELGSGKTCFVQGLAQAMGIEEPVNSPTYTLINEYRGKRALYHMDLYRLRDSLEAWETGLEEYFDNDGITAIEWAERADDLLPERTLHLVFKNGSSPETRQISLYGGNKS